MIMWVFMEVYVILGASTGFMAIFKHLWESAYKFEYVNVYGYLWESMGVYGYLWVSSGVSRYLMGAQVSYS